jgi:hypothetical protein
VRELQSGCRTRLGEPTGIGAVAAERMVAASGSWRGRWWRPAPPGLRPRKRPGCSGVESSDRFSTWDSRTSGLLTWSHLDLAARYFCRSASTSCGVPPASWNFQNVHPFVWGYLRPGGTPITEARAMFPNKTLIRYAARPRSCRSSEVPVMESAYHRLRFDRTESGRFRRSCGRTVFPQSEVGPGFM